MTQITAAQVKELRDRTGLGMMDCKKALVEKAGNIEEAIDLLRKNSGSKAAKKANRTAAEGVVLTRISDTSHQAIMLEINCETDFVAKDANFLSFANDAADLANSTGASSIDELLTEEVQNKREQLIQKIGENINIRRITRIDSENNYIYSYVHNGKIAVLVELENENNELGRDIAMHVAASSPVSVSPEDVDKSLLEREKAIYEAQANESGKPQDIVEKMVQGRVKKFLQEVSLTEQPFIKDPDTKIGSLLSSANNKVISFYRYEVGDGIEKEETDFAEEVRQQAGI